MSSWVYLFVAIIAEVIGTSALKSSEGFERTIPSVIVIVAYSASFYFLSLTLKTMPVGVAYAVWSGVGILLITAIGWLAFGQKLGGAGIVGVTLITVGVIVLNLASKPVPQS
jgi:multidrug transporter EmrE-like cation transporter